MINWLFMFPKATPWPVQRGLVRDLPVPLRNVWPLSKEFLFHGASYFGWETAGMGCLVNFDVACASAFRGSS